jgi:type IV pilus assembly protein PilY1
VIQENDMVGVVIAAGRRVLVIAGLACAANSAVADQTDLATQPLGVAISAPKPNILFVLDNSNSMDTPYMPDTAFNGSGSAEYVRNIAYNTLAYDPGVTYLTSPKGNAAGDYWESMNRANTTGWTKVRRNGFSSFASTYNIVSDSYYYKSTYLAGVETRTRVTIASGSTYPKASTRTDCLASACTYDEEMTNYTNWYSYYRLRMLAMKSGLSLSFASLGSNVRMGLMAIDPADNGVLDFLNVSDFDATQKELWYKTLHAIVPKQHGDTPLRPALSTAGRYFAGRVSTINGESAKDPMQYSCQRNYTLLSTDGYWTVAQGTKVDGSTLVGDQDANLNRPYFDGTATSDTLADVAQYYYSTDLRDAMRGTQNMVTYTIGLGAAGKMKYRSDYATAGSGDYFDVAHGTPADAVHGICTWQTGSGPCNWPVPVAEQPTAVDDLWHAAVNGHGAYYSAANAADLKAGVASFIKSVEVSSAAQATGTSSVSNFSAGTQNYVFSSRFCSLKWFGELARYTADAATGKLSPTPDWAQSGGGSDCAGASGSNPATMRLDQRSASERRIYTLDDGRSTASLVSFEWGSLSSTSQKYFSFAAIKGTLSQACSSGADCIPSASQGDSTGSASPGAGGYNLVNYLRGDSTRAQDDSNAAADTRLYRSREHKLGDIVGSQAVYVQAPSFGYADKGYAEFKIAQAARQGMVYVGANDGMLHAFDATDGSETWAYIPSMLLPQLYKLADKRYASQHIFLVDGPGTSADVYDGSAWHTILVGGLGGGGRGFYALDVTKPGTPAALWEFTHDTSRTSPYVTDADLGYSFGTPVVTKLSDGTWVVLVTSGYNNVVPGSGHGTLWVLNALTGSIIKKIDTGAGSSGSTVPGCTAAPCPSGFAQISAWVANPANNTVTQVYGGDLYGNLWRINLSTLTSANAGTASVAVRQLATLADGSGVRQPVSTRPELGVVSGSRVVYVGTGRYLGKTDLTTSQQQSIYAIKDPVTSNTGLPYASPRSNACSESKTTNCFVQQRLSDSNGKRTATSTVSYPVDFSGMHGWFEDLPETAERINTDPTLQLGTLVYVSNIPSGDADVCTEDGSSYLNYVDYATGLQVSGSSDAGALLTDKGTSSAPGLAMTTQGNAVAYTRGSDGSTAVSKVPTASVPTQTRRLSWRELITGQ